MSAPTNSKPPQPPARLLSAENYRFLQDYIRRESGIALDSDKLYLLESRLTPVLEQERLQSLDALCSKLRSAPSEALRRRVVESMTTHETLFFRDPAVFEALKTVILPEIAARRQAVKAMRIWSAACSSGQEAYSVAMLLVELGYAGWNVQIIGTDLSSQIAARATAGRFLQIEVNRGLPASMLVKYFERAGLDWQVKEQLRRMTRFSVFDLRQNMTSLGPFDLVLCRNVLIYFEMDTRRRILAGIRGALTPGGYLILGASETTFNLDNNFVRKAVGGAIVYQSPASHPAL